MKFLTGISPGGYALLSFSYNDDTAGENISSDSKFDFVITDGSSFFEAKSVNPAEMMRMLPNEDISENLSKHFIADNLDFTNQELTWGNESVHFGNVKFEESSKWNFLKWSQAVANVIVSNAVCISI